MGHGAPASPGVSGVMGACFVLRGHSGRLLDRAGHQKDQVRGRSLELSVPTSVPQTGEKG